MKKTSVVFVLSVAIALILSSCGGNKPGGDLKTHSDTIAYVIGANIGNNLKENINRDSLDLGIPSLIQGFKDALEGVDSTIFKSAEKQKIMAAFQTEMQKRQQENMLKAAEPNKAEGAKFLADNKTKAGVITLPSGLQYKVIKEGTGKTPKETDQVTVNYEGKFLNGKIFDSSFERNQPATFPLSGVIKGWTEGLQHMKEGGSYELYVPSDLAYGDQGNQGIPGGSTLIFKVDLIKIEAPAADKGGETKPKAKGKG
ncbi:MAG: FKBP-type peptidyl-prolyl cis-trans isomerase [Bacteroidota bacterium]